MPPFPISAASCLRLGSLVNRGNLGRDIGLPQPTAHRFLNLLETSYLFVRVPAYSVNRTKRLIKSPKLYWGDTGLAMHLSQEDEPRGAHLENLVLQDLLVWRDSRPSRAEVLHWHTTMNEEVDFVVEAGATLLPIEVKATHRPGLRDVAHLHTFRNHPDGRRTDCRGHPKTATCNPTVTPRVTPTPPGCPVPVPGDTAPEQIMKAPMNAPPAPSAPPCAVMPPVLLVTLLATASCDDGTGPGSPDTLASWSLSDEPAVVIGGADEREGYLLHQVVAAIRLGDGRIVVLNGSSLELKYYDPEGVHLLDAGGEGKGPGEFQWFWGATRLPGDSILVLSGTGLTRFGPDGRYASSIPFESPPPGECRWNIEGGQRPLADGSILAVFMVFVGIYGNWRCPRPSEAQPPALVGRFIPTTGVFDTIAELPGVEESYGDSRYAHPRNLVYAVADDGVYLGDTGSDTILVMSMTGDTIATLPVPFEPAPVPADAREETGSTRRTIIYPDHYPRFARLVAGPGNRVWVMAYPPLKEPVWHWDVVNARRFRRTEDGGARWRVVGRDGLVIAELRTPEGFFLLEVGDDHVLGVSKDELDRESVRLYRLTR